jgi:alginate O-acetyltransferase complex protein AlgJ
MRTDLLKTLSVLAVIFAGFASVVVRSGDAILRIFGTAEVTDFMSGTLSGKLDRAVFESIPRSPALDGLATGLIYARLHDAGSQVRAGCSNWLYSSEELRVERHDMENIMAHADVLRVLASKLAERNILLVMLPVPDKAEQVEDQLCGMSARQSRFRTDVWRQATQAIGALQIDLRNGWPRPGYWHTDTHWDSDGARFAADAAARIVTAKLGAGTEGVRLAQGASHERIGDLARLAGLADAPRWLAPAFDHETDVKAEIQRSGGLLDDTPAPAILLAGSSYSLNSGFIDYLQASLSREVAQASQAGGGFAGALLDLIQNRPTALAEAKAVIWEWPMRSLTHPLTDAERRLLKQAAN